MLSIFGIGLIRITKSSIIIIGIVILYGLLYIKEGLIIFIEVGKEK